jgi:hypothetical protein
MSTAPKQPPPHRVLLLSPTFGNHSTHQTLSSLGQARQRILQHYPDDEFEGAVPQLRTTSEHELGKNLSTAGVCKAVGYGVSL